jgi:hypothetical protein
MQRKLISQKRFKEKRVSNPSYSALAPVVIFIIVFSIVTWLFIFRGPQDGTDARLSEHHLSTKPPVLPPGATSGTATSGTLSGPQSHPIETKIKPIQQGYTSTAPEIVLKTIRRSSSQDGDDFHFVHIPKCGGTSMTTVLRQVACKLDPNRNKDCCLNPGFCDWHAMRRCLSIKGCINHFPNRKWIFKPVPSITIIREPISR